MVGFCGGGALRTSGDLVALSSLSGQSRYTPAKMMITPLRHADVADGQRSTASCKRFERIGWKPAFPSLCTGRAYKIKPVILPGW